MRSDVRPLPPGPGQESVWDYPRPPRVEPERRRIEVRSGNIEIASTLRAWRVLETSHPSTYYLPPEEVRMDLLVPSPRSSFCEWKGAARYFDLVFPGDEGERLGAVAWSYSEPLPGFEPIRDHVAFYPHRLECYVDGERAEPQPGAFYGGWVTGHIVGPFKGEPGSQGW